MDNKNEYRTRAEIHEQTDKMLNGLLANPHPDVVCFLFETLIGQFKEEGIPKQELSDKFTQTLDKLYATTGLKLVPSSETARAAPKTR